MQSVRYLAATALATSLFSLASPAFAQAADSADSTAKPEAAATAVPATTKPAAETNEIVVVGSRIKRDAFNSASPVQLITREETTLAGFNSTSEVLQSTSVTGGTAQINNAFGGFVTDGGPGANTISLRGLGASRSLVLLNGRRLAPAGTRGSVGAADLNTLPGVLLDRIEILKDGASSIYGSDAVAGVINAVTRKKVDGITVEGGYTGTDGGGGNTMRLSALGGYTGDRLSVTASVEYLRRSNLTLADRDWTQCNTDFRINTAVSNMPGSADFIDPRTGKPKCYPITGTGSNGVTINTIGTNTRSGIGAAGSVTPGALSNFNRFRPNSAVTAGLVGFEGVGGGTNNLNVRDTFDPRSLRRSLISPAKIYTGFLDASYDLQALGDAQVYIEALGTKRSSSQVGYRQLILDYIKGSPLIPAVLQPVTFQSVPTAVSNGQAVGVRAFIGFGNDFSNQEVEFFRFTGGVKGQTSISDWRYDLYATTSYSTGRYTARSFLTDRVAQSLNVVSNGSGGFNCVNPANGCVAAPALTAAVIGGDLPQNFSDFIFQPVTGTSKFNEQVVNLTLDGTLFSLPYGKVKSAIGFEYRQSKINDTPPADSQIGNLYNLTSAAVTRGKDSVWEAYGEVEVPLLRNLPFANFLTLNGSARYTHYKSYGGDYTYKIGGEYGPTKWLTFRATYGTSYRAPALFEQFLGATSGFLPASSDPCAQDRINNSPVRVVNCAAEGIGQGFNPTSGVTVFNSGGAAAGLEAETSKNYTIGTVIQPDFGSGVGKISFAVDYYRIRVSNGVARAGASNILSLCYNDPQFRTGGGLCRLINPRAPGSNALTVNDSFINLATDQVRGIDYTLRYTRDLGQGTLRLNAVVSQFFDQSSRLFSTDALDDNNGTITNPKMTGDFDVSYTIKKWQVRYGLEWVDATQSYDFQGLDRATTQFKFDTPDYFLHNMSVRYRTDKMTITAGVRNMFDKDPPRISSGLFNLVGNAPLYSGYDYFGRRFFMNVSRSF